MGCRDAEEPLHDGLRSRRVLRDRRQRHHGPEAFDEIFGTIRERWADFRLDPLEFYEAGERVRVLGTLVARAHDRKPFASVAGQVWTLRKGKLAALQAFLSSEEAIRAAGLTRLLT